MTDAREGWVSVDLVTFGYDGSPRHDRISNRDVRFFVVDDPFIVHHGITIHPIYPPFISAQILR